jgi:diaminopropionate ammonia-lyase
MGAKFDYILRERGRKPADLHAVSLEEAKKAQHFHSGFPGYEFTPLAELDCLAKDLGVAKVYVKDESCRFGLNAFKVLGGGYAIGNYLAQRLGKKIDEVSFDSLTSESCRRELGDVTFVTATDGNHGRGVAWMANKLRQHSVVYMPKGSAKERLENIRKENADAFITDLNYDGAVHLAEKHAAENGWVLTQDTAWDGYEEIPTWIMQGYMTLSYEILQQLHSIGAEKPTHLILQAGVGSFASSVLGFFASVYGEERPKTIIVEPEAAACLFKSAKADDGKVHFVTGDMNTIMAGLACGEPSTVSYRIIDSYADAFVSCSDEVSAEGMRVLGNPMGSDRRVVSGESGAVGAGLLREIMRNPALAPLREKLGFSSESRVLLISTEGDTDRENYRRIVWDGAHASEL